MLAPQPTSSMRNYSRGQAPLYAGEVANHLAAKFTNVPAIGAIRGSRDGFHAVHRRKGAGGDYGREDVMLA